MKAFVWTMGVGDLRLASEEKGLCMNRSREGGSGKKKNWLVRTPTHALPTPY